MSNYNYDYISDLRKNDFEYGVDAFYWINNRINIFIQDLLYVYFLTDDSFEKMENCLYKRLNHKLWVIKNIISNELNKRGPSKRWASEYSKDSDHKKKNNCHVPGKTYMMKKGKWVEVEMEIKEKNIEITYED
jgi:hypothetical protein